MFRDYFPLQGFGSVFTQGKSFAQSNAGQLMAEKKNDSKYKQIRNKLVRAKYASAITQYVFSSKLESIKPLYRLL